MEKLIADNFPDDDAPYEDLLIGLMENIADSLSEEVDTGLIPSVIDPVLDTNDLAVGYTNADFKSFFLQSKNVSMSYKSKVLATILGARFLVHDFPQAPRTNQVRALHSCQPRVRYAFRIVNDLRGLLRRISQG